MDAMTWYHIYPLQDLREHVTDGGECWCEPEVDHEDLLIIHNALDGREQVERGQKRIH